MREVAARQRWVEDVVLGMVYREEWVMQQQQMGMPIQVFHGVPFGYGYPIAGMEMLQQQRQHQYQELPPAYHALSEHNLAAHNILEQQQRFAQARLDQQIQEDHQHHELPPLEQRILDQVQRLRRQAQAEVEVHALLEEDSDADEENGRPVTGVKRERDEDNEEERQRECRRWRAWEM